MWRKSGKFEGFIRGTSRGLTNVATNKHKYEFIDIFQLSNSDEHKKEFGKNILTNPAHYTLDEAMAKIDAMITVKPQVSKIGLFGGRAEMASVSAAEAKAPANTDAEPNGPSSSTKPSND